MSVLIFFIHYLRKTFMSTLHALIRPSCSVLNLGIHFIYEEITTSGKTLRIY